MSQRSDRELSSSLPKSAEIFDSLRKMIQNMSHQSEETEANFSMEAMNQKIESERVINSLNQELFSYKENVLILEQKI